MISCLRTKFNQKGSFKSRNHTDRPRYPTEKEDIDNVTSSRCNRFLSSTRLPDLIRNATGPQILDKNSSKTKFIFFKSGVRLC